LILSILSLFVFNSSLIAQTIFPNFVDGEIYVKIDESSALTLPIIKGSNFTIENKQINILFSKYKILEISKAYNFRNDKSVDNIYKLKINDMKLVENFIEESQKIIEFNYAEKVPLYTSNCTSESTGFWGTPNVAQNFQLNLVNASGAYGILTGTGSVTVAVIDNEFNINHQNLTSNVLTSSWDVADNNASVSRLSTNLSDHGTHVAGILSASNENSIGIASLGGGNSAHLAPVRLMCLKAQTDALGATSPGGINFGYQSIDYAASHGARIISCSWGSQSTNNCTPMSASDQFALRNTMSRYPNFVLVCAAGNGFTTNPAYPAGAKRILDNGRIGAFFLSEPMRNRIVSVANTNNLDVLSTNSNRGQGVDVCAPGTSIYSSVVSLQITPMVLKQELLWQLL
jgi:subtilisin family serine protease